MDPAVDGLDVSPAGGPCRGHDQYKMIAEKYASSKLMPFRTESETPSFMSLVAERGTPNGTESICDLACGEGFYTRMCRQITAGRVAGIDISESMIGLARQQEEKTASEGRKIDYHVGDCCQPLPKELQESFDVVTGTFLLNYATSPLMIRQFCETACSLLKPGGRFLGINDNPFMEVSKARFADQNKYGIFWRMGSWDAATPETASTTVEEGEVLHIRLQDPESGKDGDCVEFDNYWWGPETYECAFQEVGFSKLEWIPMTMAGDGIQESQYKEEYWKDWLENCPICCFAAVKE